MMTGGLLIDAPQPGQIVRVRSRQYLVDDVAPPPRPGDATLVRLSCLDDDAQGTALSVLWECELDARVLEVTSWRDVAKRGFDPPARFAAYLHAQRWNCVTSTTPRLFQSPFRAGIRVDAYQLEPLRKALALPRVNLFIADDVGLGKTVEAGLILRELLMRQKVRRVVVAAPPSVVLQWRDELDARFGLPFVILDRDYVLAKRRERGYGVNPWSTHSRFIISHALLRNEEYAGALRDWLADEGPGPALLILDEAHNAAPASGAKYAIDSKMTRVVREIAPRFDHKLFLSATPHNGHTNSFSALMEILDPQRFVRGEEIESAKQLEPVMVRRLKGDLRKATGEFPERKVVQIDISGLAETAPELELSRLLDEYRTVREALVASAARSAQAAAALVTIALQKRLLSSIEAFACTLRVHRRGALKQIDAAVAKRPAKVNETQLALAVEAPGSDDERAELPEAQVQAEVDAEIELASEALGGDDTARDTASLRTRATALLDRMFDIAEATRHEVDPRTERLLAWMREHLLDGRRWKNRRVLIFTEYADTKRYLEERLREAFADTDDAERRIGTFHGGMDDESREAIKRSFNADPVHDPLRILIATDAAREGVNLQNHCADLFHYDVPWNPSRMEQRNGRIDRKLQREAEVRCHYFVYTQRPEDRVLQTLVEKTATIQKELGSLSQVVEVRLVSMLAAGIRRADARTLAQHITALDASARSAVVDRELEAVRVRHKALAENLDLLRNILQDSKKAIAITPSALRHALDASLALHGAPALAPVDTSEAVDDPSRVRWTFPPLDTRAGADASWADTLDTLRAPRKKDEKPWDWRRRAPIRPVVFADAGSLDADVVHLHLEHRVVQRLLGRFLSQGFVHDDLTRATVLRTDATVPRVVLLARLSLYGDQASRLHDEIVATPARWTDPADRSEPLKPYAETTRLETLALLEDSLSNIALHSVPEAIRQTLAASVERDVKELLGSLRARAMGLADGFARKLIERGAIEAAEMEAVLKTQKLRIARLVAEEEPDVARGQLSFDERHRGWDAQESEQKAADLRHWKKRLAAIDREIVAEPAKIRRSYEVRAERIEPIGIVYLWPVTG